MIKLHIYLEISTPKTTQTFEISVQHEIRPIAGMILFFFKLGVTVIISLSFNLGFFLVSFNVKIATFKIANVIYLR